MTATDAGLDPRGEALLDHSMRRFWHPVLYASDLGDRPVGVTLLGEPVVVVRLPEGVRAFPDICVHRGTALSLGSVEDGWLVCPYHGWSFDGDGICRRIPATHGRSIPTRARLRSLRAVERFGLVWVCLDGDGELDVPEFPEFGDEGYRIVSMPTCDWNCSAARRIENFIDFSHFPFVHEGVLGTREHAVTPEHDVVRRDGDLTFSVSLIEPVDPLKHEPAETHETVVRRYTDYRVLMPFTAYLNQKLPGDEHFVLYLAASPVAPRTTRSFTFIARNYLTDASHDAAFVEMQERILEQDRPVVESQRPEELPIDLSAELHIKGPDQASIVYRRWLIEIARLQAS